MSQDGWGKILENPPDSNHYPFPLSTRSYSKIFYPSLCLTKYCRLTQEDNY